MNPAALHPLASARIARHAPGLALALTLIGGPLASIARAQGITRPDRIDLADPVVLVHGIFSVHRDPGSGKSRGYFNGVVDHLRARGVTVTSPHMGFCNGIEPRAERLADHLEHVFPGRRIHLIAHSIGGLAARHLITHMGYGDRVISLTTIGTPHRGSPVADWADRYVGQGLGVELILARLGLDVGAIRDLTAENCRFFNEHTPDDPRVHYRSFGGAKRWTKMHLPLMPTAWLIRLIRRARQGQTLPAGVSSLLASEDWGPDVLEAVRLESQRRPETVRAPPEGADDPGGPTGNDGVVPLDSTPWGSSHDTLEMDHLDQIGWRQRRPTVPAFYESVVRDLARQFRGR